MKDIISIIIQQIKEKSPDILAFFTILILFYLGAILAKRIFNKLALKTTIEKSKIFQLFGSIIKTGLIILGFISAFGTLGIDVSGMVAGLGLTGFALGFALKDALSNLLAGVLILFYQPFKCGDEIEVAKCIGKVINIDLRYTTLQSNEYQYLIPNSTCFKNWIAIKNYSASD